MAVADLNSSNDTVTVPSGSGGSSGTGKPMETAISRNATKPIRSDNRVESLGSCEGVSDRCSAAASITAISAISQCDSARGERSLANVR